MQHSSTQQVSRVCQAIFFCFCYSIWNSVTRWWARRVFWFPLLPCWFFLSFFLILPVISTVSCKPSPFFSLSLFPLQKRPQLPGPSAWRAVKRDPSADELKLESLPVGECSRHRGTRRGRKKLIRKRSLLWHNKWLICLNTTKTIHLVMGTVGRAALCRYSGITPNQSS